MCDNCPACVQSKKVERDAMSSSESEDDKEDKITVAYKSKRSAVSLDYLPKKRKPCLKVKPKSLSISVHFLLI